MIRVCKTLDLQELALDGKNIVMLVLPSFRNWHVTESHTSLVPPFQFGRVCGTMENASGLRSPGVTVAVTKCRLHALSFETIQGLEKEHPLLVLKLYKMLSHLMARRQDITVQQLSTMYSIISSPAHSKPVSRAAAKAFL